MCNKQRDDVYLTLLKKEVNILTTWEEQAYCWFNIVFCDLQQRNNHLTR